MFKHAFTLIELIVAIVIIGVLGAVAIPQFGSLIDNSKISSEKATAASIQTTLDTIHSDWVLNGANCPFEWGNKRTHNPNDGLGDPEDLNDNGYPKALGSGSTPDAALDYLFSQSQGSDFKKTGGTAENKQYFTGPATREVENENRTGKPEKGECWEYDPQEGTFELLEDSDASICP